jgi:predicted metal-dependent phosphotriesterase family hydrolase
MILSHNANLRRMTFSEKTTGYSFPPADMSPLASMRVAGFDAVEIKKIGEQNPRRLFPRLK